MSLENLETTVASTLEPTMLRSLKTLALQHKKRLFVTFGLVAAENLLLLIYPLVGSFAVNAVLNGQLISALAYALIVLIIWGKAWSNKFPPANQFIPSGKSCMIRLFLTLF
ncbi:ABC transporter six-transmembrane domain-containing protein [Glaesserella parasuis]|nr:ABC transporter six-transmembrane domain-containing protein [Glaesserella parasuis]